MHAIFLSFRTLLFLSLLLWLPFLPARAQTSTPTQTLLLVSPHVGEVIDQEEKIRFNLFPFFISEEYQIGRFFQLPDKQIVLEVIKKNGQVETRQYTQTEFDLTGELIAAKAASGQAALPPPRPGINPPALPGRPESRQTFQASTQVLTGKVYYVILNDGMKFFANIAEKRAQEYVFATQYYGTFTAAFSEIRYLKEVENKLRRDAYWIPNPHDSRLFFGPTGRGIPGGEGYFQTIWGYLNSFNYGVTDHLSLGTTFFLFPGVPLEYSVYSFTPKISLPVTPNVSVAAGVLYASLFDNKFGLVYGAGTLGNKNDHLTAGLGFGFLDNELSKTPVVMFGGVKRVSNRLSLMTENYVVNFAENEATFEEKETYVGGLYGLRFIWPRTNLDLAGFYVYNPSSFNMNLVSSYILPAYVSFTCKLGTRKHVGRAF